MSALGRFLPVVGILNERQKCPFDARNQIVCLRPKFRAYVTAVTGRPAIAAGSVQSMDLTPPVRPPLT